MGVGVHLRPSSLSGAHRQWVYRCNDVPFTRVSLPLPERHTSPDTASPELVYVDVPPVTLPVTTYSVAFGQLVPDWDSLRLTVVVPPLGLHVSVPEPVAKEVDMPVAFLFLLLLGVHFVTVKLPAAVPESFLQAIPEAAPAGVDRDTAASETGRLTAVMDATTRKIRRMMTSLPFHIRTAPRPTPLLSPVSQSCR
jgi:hypothetical protein